MPNFLRRLACVFGTLTFVAAFLAGAMANASGFTCEGLFEPAVTARGGVLESAIEQLEQKVQTQREKAAATLASLDLANNGWWPLEAHLIINVEIQVSKFREAQKAAFAAGRQTRNVIEIRRRLQALLRPSTPFRSLTPVKLRALIDRLMNESDLSSPNVINSAKHILYRSMALDGLSDAVVLRDAIAILDAQALLIDRWERQQLPKMRSFVAARGAHDLPALTQRRDAMAQVIDEMIQKTKPVPDNVVNETATLAREFRKARAASQNTADIVARWKQLTKTDVFFAGLADGDAEAIGFEWTKVTSPESTVKMFVMNTSAGSPTLALRYRDLDEINRALKYLEPETR